MTGGCAGEGCCDQGCCEFINIASRCSVFSDGLPACSACMARTAPAAAGSALSDRLYSGIGDGSGAGVSSGTIGSGGSSNPAAWYLDLFKAVVLNAIARPSPEKIDGHQWRKLFSLHFIYLHKFDDRAPLSRSSLV